MKFQALAFYPLHLDFESQLGDFFKNDKSKELISEIMDIRLNPTHKISIENPIDMYMETITQARIGFNTDIREDGIYVSSLFMILRKIGDTFIAKLPNNTIGGGDYSVIMGILKGGMKQEYYTTGREGEKLIDILDEQCKKNDGDVFSIRNKLIPFYLEEVEKKGKRENLKGKLANQIDKFVHLTDQKLTKRTIETTYRLYSEVPDFYKFSKEGLSFAKLGGLSDEVIKGLKQIRVKRIFRFDIYLLIAIITTIYFDTELFLYYNPYMYQLGICDKENLVFKGSHIYIVMNFTDIIKHILCEHCLVKMTSDTKRELRKGKLSPKNNRELIKKMFDDLYNQIDSIRPDDFSLNAECKINNKNRYEEVNDKVKNGDIGYVKHGGEKQKIKISIKDSLKNYIERLKNK